MNDPTATPARPGGPPTKLTPERMATITSRIASGSTFKDAYLAAGICKKTFYRWLAWGAVSREPIYEAFFRELRAASLQGDPARIKADPRRLARMRYEYGASKDQVSVALYKEIMRAIKEGRVQWPAAMDALEMSLDDIRDRQIENSTSWADNPGAASVTGGDRAVADTMPTKKDAAAEEKVAPCNYKPTTLEKIEQAMAGAFADFEIDVPEDKWDLLCDALSQNLARILT